MEKKFTVKEEFSRTARLLGEGAIERLQKSRVAVFGVGGVGGSGGVGSGSGSGSGVGCSVPGFSGSWGGSSSPPQATKASSSVQIERCNQYFSMMGCLVCYFANSRQPMMKGPVALASLSRMRSPM